MAALRVGVLIIGSLLWDEKHNRPDWRARQLRMSAAQRVLVPIRYGRYSERGTYTMVFSPLCEKDAKLGVGYAIRCIHDVSMPGDLLEEADALATAERLPRTDNRGSPQPPWKEWGAVALLTNPKTHASDSILSEWKKYFAVRAPHCELVGQHIEGEEPVMSANGFLRIGWPTCLDSGHLVDTDLFLATPTAPKLKDQRIATRYPRPAEIAAACDNPEYFVENVRHRIRTAEDTAIWTEMVGVQREWNRKYADVTAIIQGADGSDV